ncbi:MAG: PEP-CTERM sorting domain-containing protein [Phycisphaerae bacterium]|nr:PEP-CTERM sorting domain-containing protein [Phycisphaerae bacterium]
MMRKIAVIAVCLGIVGVAHGQLSIDVGDHDLLPNQSGQTIEVYVAGGVPVQNVDVYAQIGDGGPLGGGSVPGPVFTLLDLFDDDPLTSFIFDPNNDGLRRNPPYGVLVPQIAYEGIMTASGEISANGLLAIFTIDTTGYTEGTWDFLLTGTNAGNTIFGYGGNEVPMTVTNGSITVIPEPASLSILLLGAGWVLSRRRRSRD